MDGRVKTLHPKIHGGILGRRDQDQAIMAAHAIEAIDLVCVNLYPFEETIANPDKTHEDAIENIDIGGPAMVRSAAKNHQFVGIVTSPLQYQRVLSELDANGAVCDASHGCEPDRIIKLMRADTQNDYSIFVPERRVQPSLD